jgi:hypothetical protein
MPIQIIATISQGNKVKLPVQVLRHLDLGPNDQVAIVLDGKMACT